MPKGDDRLRTVLTKKQLAKVTAIVNSKVGSHMRLEALKEYYNKPNVSKRLNRMGWNPDTLAYSTMKLVELE